jgi:serine-type D-Ala-D-Ala carboxypeptidase/endopeptidase (penicillin-binding protein 4)
VRRTRVATLTTLAMLNVFTLAASVTVARMLPSRLAALHIPVAASRPAVGSGTVLTPVGDAGGADGLPTAAGLSSALGRVLSGAIGPQLGIVVADASTGRLLYSRDGETLATPASTTKVATAVAALAALGPDARFTTRVVKSPDGIVLVGGGDPTLAVNRFPSADYPQPATLAALAGATARALKAAGRRSVVLGYDTSLYSGQTMAPGWSYSDVASGNVTPIVSLEVDQGRLTRAGTPEDRDDGSNFTPRTTDPAGMAASAFASLLQRDGITVTGTPVTGTAPAGAATLASVSSPPLSGMVQQMLQESNNVIAENLARHLALAVGQPASFSGAAAAVAGELRRLGVTSGVSLVDGSGLSSDDGIAPAALVRVLEIAAGRGGTRERAAITGLPVAGFSGTLSAGQSVFGGIGGSALGVLRAKTGNLITVASLAGLVQDRDGRLLAFAIMADQIPGAAMLQPAANDIDSAAAALAACGCR